MLPRDALAKAAEVLGSASEVSLVCHVNPDADAIGSMLGLAVYLDSRGIKVAATVPNGLRDLPRWVEVLPGRHHLVEPGAMAKKPLVLVTLDAADAARLAGLSHLLERADEVICVDHHRTNPGFGTVNLVDPDAAATAQIVYLLIERMGGPLGDDTAACLYAGLVTDTGRLQYESASPEVLRMAADLRERDFDHTRLVQALYEDNSLAYLRLLGVALDRAAHVDDADLVWTYVLRKDLKGAGVEIQETDDLIDIVRTARESDVAAVIKEQREDGFKVSLRSRGRTDVAAVAESFGGGGHRLAAGYTHRGTLEEASGSLIEALTAARARAAS